MTDYRKKSEAELVWDDNKDYVRGQATLILNRLKRRLVNDALTKMSKEFQEGLDRGELLRLGPSTKEVAELVSSVATELMLEISVDSE